MVEILFFIAATTGYCIWAIRRDRPQSPPAVKTRQHRLQYWQHVAEKCGLRVTETTSAPALQLKAQEGLTRVEIASSGPEWQDTRIEIKAPVAPDFEMVAIRPRPHPHLHDVEVGDLGFSNTFHVEGPTLQVFALLDAGTRQLLQAMNAAGRLEISPGLIVALVRPDVQVSTALPFLLEIRNRLATPAKIPGSLVENVKTDPDGGVRLQNLLLLLREFPEDPSAVDALRAACLDRSSAIRMRAAKELGAEGRDTLRQIASGLEEDALSAEAVSLLDRELGVESARNLFERAWSTGRERTAYECLKVLGRSGETAVGTLVEVLSLQNHAWAIAAIQALGEIGSLAAESALIQALQREEDDLRIAAANALGRFGSAAAVLPLQEAAVRFPLDRKFRHATRQAIAEIQSRAGGASPGQLSLADGEAGQLSLAHDPAGQLSISGDETLEPRS